MRVLTTSSALRSTSPRQIPLRNPFATDAETVFRALAEAGLRIGIVSDIHFDIRPAFVHVGLDPFVSAYSLSYELGVQKLDHKIFHHALAPLHVAADHALMVGDRSHPDGGAVEHGIPTLLVPTLKSVDDCRLDLVLSAAGVRSSLEQAPPT